MLLPAVSVLVSMPIWCAVLAVPGLVTLVMVARILWPAGIDWLSFQVSELPVPAGSCVLPRPWPVVRLPASRFSPAASPIPAAIPCRSSKLPSHSYGATRKLS